MKLSENFLMGMDEVFRDKVKRGDHFAIITNVKSGAKKGSFRAQGTLDEI